ncbi:MAG: DUF2100 domain-containing protein [Candidatus Lokiarchaeota archaeon]
MIFTLNPEEVETLLKAMDNLVDIRAIIRKVTPDYEFTGDLENKFKSNLEVLYNNLEPIFLKYLDIKKPFMAPNQVIGIKGKIIHIISQGNMLLISSNSSKKILKSLGLDPRKFFITGGPLFYEDYKVVNPNLPEKALAGIKRKCEKLEEDLQKENWSNKDLYFVYVKDNVTDNLILKKLDKISGLINKKVKSIQIDSWEDLK